MVLSGTRRDFRFDVDSVVPSAISGDVRVALVWQPVEVAVSVWDRLDVKAQCVRLLPRHVRRWQNP